jgi:hypothetical protein
MGLVQYLRGEHSETGNRLRVSELGSYDPGHTVPPVNREQAGADVLHLKSFETIAKALKEATAAVNQNTDDMIELDRVAADERRRLDEQRSDLAFKKNTLLDQLQQYIENTVEHGKLVIEPPPPDPNALDVRFETTPPAVPQEAVE